MVAFIASLTKHWAAWRKRAVYRSIMATIILVTDRTPPDPIGVRAVNRPTKTDTSGYMRSTRAPKSLSNRTSQP